MLIAQLGSLALAQADRLSIRETEAMMLFGYVILERLVVHPVFAKNLRLQQKIIADKRIIKTSSVNEILVSTLKIVVLLVICTYVQEVPFGCMPMRSISAWSRWCVEILKPGRRIYKGKVL